MNGQNHWNKSYYAVAHGDIDQILQKSAHAKKLDRYIKENVKENGRILEIGCGLAAFANLVPDDVFYTGIDTSRYAISEVEKTFIDKKNVTLLVGEAEQLPLEDGSFDLVIMRNVLQMLSKPKESLLEIARVLKKGGRVFIIAPNYESPFSHPNAIRHKGVLYKTTLFFCRLYDYICRLFGRYRFRTIKENVVQATGENILPDDDLLYLVSSYEVISFLESQGFDTVETQRFSQSKNFLQKIKSIVTKLPGLSYLGIELLVISEKK